MYIYIYLFIHLINHLLIYSIIYAYHRLIQPAWAGGEAGLAKIMKIMKIMRHDATCWSGTTMVGWHIVASSTFHLHVRAQVRSKTPRVETSVVIANQHPQLPKKLNFVFVVVARMPPPRTPSNKVGFIRFVFLLVRLCESTLHRKGRGEEGGEVKFLGEWITFLVRAEGGGCSP